MAALDLLIAGVTVVDGSGSSAFEGSVGIKDEQIACVVHGLAEIPASRVIDGTGLVLAPGFIDVHTHADWSPFLDASMESFLVQGVTSVIVGNCGLSIWPPAGQHDLADLLQLPTDRLPVAKWPRFGDYLAALDACRPATNVGVLVGHGAVWNEVCGCERKPSARDFARMERLCAEAAADGALGVSTGLIYPPSMFGDASNISEVVAGIAPYGGLYVTHLRGEGERLFAAVAEAMEIGKSADVRVHISHLKLEGKYAWGRADELLDLVDASGATGDQYPYTSWMTSLSTLLPPWALAENQKLLAHSDARALLKESIECGEEEWESSVAGAGWERIVLTGVGRAEWEGQSIATLAAGYAEEPFDTMLRVIFEAPDALAIGHAMQEEDLRALMRSPSLWVASDALPVWSASRTGGNSGHPRTWGTFPKVLGVYVREEGVLSLERAVQKMTSGPAECFGLSRRGRIEVGNWADLVLFDPARVGSSADFSNPCQKPQGIKLVIVNGSNAWESRPLQHSGKVLLRGR